MANYGRTFTGVNRGGSQSSLMHKGMGTKFRGGRNHHGSAPNGNAWGWNWKHNGGVKPGQGGPNQGTGSGTSPMTAASAAPPATAASAPPAATPPYGKPGEMHQLPDGSPAPSAPPSTSPSTPNPTNTGGSTSTNTGSSTGTVNALPLDIEAMIQQIMASAFGKVNEAKTQAEAEQQRAFNLINNARNTALTTANQRVQSALAQVQARIGGIRF